MRTLVYSSHGFDKPFIENANAGKHEIVFTEDALNEHTAAMANGFEAVALFTSDLVSASVLEALCSYKVKYIALRSVGYDHVDLLKAKTLGMKVANVPAYSPYAVAEHAVALLMTLNRKILKARQLMKEGDFRLDSLTGFDLYGKTVGVVGTGKIGEAFSRIMNGFGCKLLGYDINENDQLKIDTKILYTDLENLCKQSDVISIHCPLNQNTRYLFNKSLFAVMKKGFVLINTARGGIINTTDLLEALENDTSASAGLDVYENEKPIFFFNHGSNYIKDELFTKLNTHPRVLLTGHQAFLTQEALEGIASTTISNLNAWESQGFSINEVS